MKFNKKIAQQKYKKLLVFDIIFAFINGLVFIGLINADSNGGYGPMILMLYVYSFDALISIGHGFVSYTKIHSFFIPHLLFYVSWVVSLSPFLFLLPEADIDYFFDIIIMAAIFLMFSCFGALVATIVMILKKRFSSSKDDVVLTNEQNSENQP